MPASRPANEKLRRILRETEWTHDRLAHAVNAVGAEAGLSLRYDRTSVAHWLRGTVPREPVPELLAEVFSRRLGRPVSCGDLGLAAAQGRPPALGDGPQAATFADLCRAWSDPEVLSGLLALPFRTRAAPLPTGLSLPAPSRPRHLPPSPPPAPAAVDHQDLAAGTLRATVQSFSRQMEVYGGGFGRSALITLLSHAVLPAMTRLGAGAALGETARLVHLLGRMFDDGQARGLAQHCFEAAHALAETAGDRSVQVIALRTLSAQAHALDQPVLALRLGESAAARAGDAVPPAVRGYVQAQLALCLARLGRREEALRALTAAERHHEQGRAACEEDPFATYPEASLLFQRAEALRELGDLRGAVEALDASLVRRTPADRRGTALSHLRRAELALDQGDVERGCSQAAKALALADELHSSVAQARWTALRGRLRRYGTVPRVRAVLVDWPRPAGVR
ncbi:hypothetical protein [Streptomyces indicus]|uniref:Tetratricopeptide repeat-containing protein n=1 Tax=Streptomyces indicus TaxID=417292 RepID=A0A1G9AVX4_9ACTN|nr:hypothetical protein [Streptomyces indicus]SDK31393.1 hypothetical protein SAMN05421806_106181 [Streptomyces indicus]